VISLRFKLRAPYFEVTYEGYRFTQSRTQLTLDHDILRTGPKVAEPRSVPESAPRERHNGDEFQKSIILTPTTTRAGNVQGPTQPRGDPYRRRTSVTDNVVPTSCAKQTNVQITLRVQAASTRPTASPPAHNGHNARAKWRRQPTTAKSCPAHATTCCLIRCRCRCQPRSVSGAHAAAAGPAGRDANLCHAVCDGGQHHSSWWLFQLPRAARLRKKMAGNGPGEGVIRARGCMLTHRRQRPC
jgi:hypothetical protein